MRGLFHTLIVTGAMSALGLSGWYSGNQPPSPPTPAPLPGGVTAAINTILPPVPAGIPPGFTTGSKADIADDVNVGVTNLDQSLRQVPGYAGQWAQNFQKYGIAAFAYEDPALKLSGQQIGAQIGAGMKAMSTAVVKDFAAGAK